MYMPAPFAKPFDGPSLFCSRTSPAFMGVRPPTGGTAATPSGGSEPVNGVAVLQRPGPVSARIKTIPPARIGVMLPKRDQRTELHRPGAHRQSDYRCIGFACHGQKPNGIDTPGQFGNSSCSLKFCSSYCPLLRGLCAKMSVEQRNRDEVHNLGPNLVAVLRM